MQRLPVESSDIVSIGYDPKAQVLEIEFKENRTYQYLDVEQRVYDLFMKADSYGEYFYAHINKHYRYKRLSGAHEAAQPPGKLAFVTSNAYKFRDAQAILEALGVEIEQLDLPVTEIQSHDKEEVALHKARQAYKLAGRSVVVQDTFWNILALRGFPGAFMSYVTEWLRVEDFLALMAGKTDRTIIRTHTIAYHDGKRSKLFSKDFAGTIIDEARGESRFSIDRIVVSTGQTKTIAEIRQEENASSIPRDESLWGEFAKWYHLQQRLGKV